MLEWYLCGWCWRYGVWVSDGRGERDRTVAVLGCVSSADGIVLRLTASFGVATFPSQADSLSALLRLADARMYRAKAQGRDSVFGEASL